MTMTNTEAMKILKTDFRTVELNTAFMQKCERLIREANTKEELLNLYETFLLGYSTGVVSMLEDS
jgi:hypothetical protein